MVIIPTGDVKLKSLLDSNNYLFRVLAFVPDHSRQSHLTFGLDHDRQSHLMRNRAQTLELFNRLEHDSKRFLTVSNGSE
jgi:hypothetical protein